MMLKWNKYFKHTKIDVLNIKSAINTQKRLTKHKKESYYVGIRKEREKNDAIRISMFKL